MAEEWGGFDHGEARASSEASDSVARKIWLLLELLRHQVVRFEDYTVLHARDKRSFQRDLQQLRTIGKTSGFTISKIEDGQCVRLSAIDLKLRRLSGAGTPVLRLLGELARTLGEPIRGEIGALAENAPEGDVFVHVQVPTLVQGSHVRRVYEKLKDAWSSPLGLAAVRFKYRTASTAAAEERTVEPYRILVRSGRYYLVGYDRKRRDWRHFALDAIVTLPVKVGTVRSVREIPTDYGSDDVLGFIKDKGHAATDVTVELSAAVAASAASRMWQAQQRVDQLSAGRVRVTFCVADPDEIVRWAFGFGAHAKIVAPPAAVRSAHDLLKRMIATYPASHV